MAYTEHGMWEVLEVLRRAHRGEGRRAIARTTGRSRKTVQRYLTGSAVRESPVPRKRGDAPRHAPVPSSASGVSKTAHFRIRSERSG